MRTISIKWMRIEGGYQSKDGRFFITKTTGRAYTRGPFRNWWSIKDMQSGLSHNNLPALVEAKSWAEERASQ